MIKLSRLLKRDRSSHAAGDEDGLSRQKYTRFRNLLSGNNEGMKIIAELEGLTYGHLPFTLDYVRGRAEALIEVVRSLVTDLEALTGIPTRLSERLDHLGATISKTLIASRSFASTGLLIPLPELNRDRVEEVGGKAANLGEAANRLGLPVPPGFAVTAYACHQFLNHSSLEEAAALKLKGLDLADTDALVTVCEEIRNLIMAAPMPPALEAILTERATAMEREYGPGFRFSVRSSATSEDSEASFAGQHSSVLNVRPANIVKAYKEVVASTYTPRAVFYRRSRGYTEQDVMMSVLCLSMVDAKASGVLYTCDPNRPSSAEILASATWGLGVSVVDGSTTTDHYRYERKDKTIATFAAAHKDRQIVMDSEEGLVKVAVDPSSRETACLTRERFIQLAEYGLRLETHYGVPLDIEWALDRSDRFVFLQVRPLRPVQVDAAGYKPVPPHEIEAEIILGGGETACSGPASGPAYLLRSENEIRSVPEGSILVAPQSSPNYVAIMGRIRGIITDVGSVTGHMATLAREFRIPTLVGVGEATSLIRQGHVITLDASNRIVYEGRVPQVADRQRATSPMKDGPVFRMVAKALEAISPLNLIDPKGQNFTPEGCITLHDIIRYTHETTLRAMFTVGSGIDRKSERRAVQIKSRLPMPVFLIDLGGGLRRDGATGDAITSADFACAPLKALWRGFTHPGVTWRSDVACNAGDFLSTLGSQATTSTMPGGESYALASTDYLNLNARFGYHFAILDACLSDEPNANYVMLQFSGGVSGFERRCLRILFLSEVLARLGFLVEADGDHLEARIRGLKAEEMERVLDQVGRLLASSRLLDMVIPNADKVNHLIDRFFAEEYDYLGQGGSSQIPGFYTHIGNWLMREREGRKIIVTDNAYRADLLDKAFSSLVSRIAGKRNSSFLDWNGANLHFPLAIVRNLLHGDCSLSVLAHPVAGAMDQAAGIAFAVESANTYLVFSLSARYQHLILRAYDDGHRRIVTQIAKEIATDHWHSLRVTIAANRVACWHNEQVAFEYVAEKPLQGSVGLWARADSVVEFSEFQMEVAGAGPRFLA